MTYREAIGRQEAEELGLDPDEIIATNRFDNTMGDYVEMPMWMALVDAG